MAPGAKKKSPRVSQASSTYVHPSLRSSSQEVPGDSSPARSQTVNERINFLRRVQASQSGSGSGPQSQSQSGISDLAASPSSSRTNVLPRVAGPKPPRSWTESADSFHLQSAAAYAYKRQASRLDYFPGVEFPPTVSLLHQSLKSLAVDFEWHVEYDHVYLASLPIRCKNLLLSYIAQFGPKDGLSTNDLLTLLYSQEELDTLLQSSDDGLTIGATGCEELDRLDLAGSVGRRTTIKQLDKFWSIKPQAAQPITPETWDGVEDTQNADLALPKSLGLRFPNLVKLSLAYPGRGIAWPEFLTFSKHLTALTHLSLAHWPTPNTSATVLPRALQRAEGSVPIPVSPSNARVARSGDESETKMSSLDDASHALRILSRNTPSLVYLSLAGCELWFDALMNITPPLGSASTAHRQSQNNLRGPEWRNMMDFGSAEDEASLPSPHENNGCPSNAGYGIDWTRNWRHITKLDLTQSSFPKSLNSQNFATPSQMYSLFEARNKFITTDRIGRVVPRNGTHEQEPNEQSVQGVYRGCEYNSACTDPVHVISRLAHMESGRLKGRRPLGLMRFMVVSSDKDKIQRVREREEGRLWVLREIDALAVSSFVVTLRHLEERHGKGKGKHIEVVHGWGKDELLAAGYTESELSEAGFWRWFD